MELKYKVGDKVRVKNGLIIDSKYDGYSFVSEMAELSGKEVTITKLFPFGYSIKEDNDDFVWTPSMLEDIPQPKYKVGDTVIIRSDLKVHECYDGGCSFTSEMIQYQGKTAKIIEAEGNDCGQDRYRITINDKDTNWYWSNSMLKGISQPKFKKGDIVRTKSDLVVNKMYSGITLLDSMKDIKGFISEVNISNHIITYNVNHWWFSEEMLELAPTVKEDDVITFNVAGQFILYTVYRCFLNNRAGGNNSYIFDKLGIVDKEAFCEKCYGYHPTITGAKLFPQYESCDYAAAQRVIDALQEECKKYNERLRGKTSISHLIINETPVLDLTSCESLRVDTGICEIPSQGPIGVTFTECYSYKEASKNTKIKTEGNIKLTIKHKSYKF